MDKQKTMARMEGCYLAVPTFFHEDMTLNLPARRSHTRFLMEGGLREGNACLLTTGAAGDFSTLTVSERLQVAEVVLEETNGRIGVIVGAQSTNQAETIEIGKEAAKLGADAIQVSPPFYHAHTADDVLEYFRAVGQAVDIGLVIYPTYWTSASMSMEAIRQLIEEVSNIVCLKWSAKETIVFLQGVEEFSKKVCVTDNHLCLIESYLSGAKSFNIHVCNYWPEWGVRLMKLLADGKYTEAHKEFIQVLLPYYELVFEIAEYTGGEGHIDKVCTELVGFDSSRCRPPTRDIRDRFRAKILAMMEKTGVPHLKN